MNLLEARVWNYKSINDTGWVEIDDLTCLIGKNESGKTAFMEAIGRLNPAYGDGAFTPYDEYPRHRWPEYKDRHEDDPDPVVSARFRLDDGERDRLEARVGDLPSPEVTVTRDYADELSWEFEIDEPAFVDRVVTDHDLQTVADEDLSDVSSIAELRGVIKDADGVTADAEAAVPAGSISELTQTIGEEVLAPELPEFRYVGEYTVLDSEIDVGAFVDRIDGDEPTDSDRVFQSLLSVAGLDVEALGGDDYEQTLTELEAASSEITSMVTRYWSQADDLRIHIRSAGGDDSPTLSLRVESPNHGVSVGFDQRSRGLRWFFSTVCTISDLRDADGEQILLLDEPGLHLHPKAKREFLEFLDEEFASEQTLVYSTHSPFMIDIDRAHRTKLIEKDDPKQGTVLKSPADADSYTQFPLRSVFELDVMETILSRSRLLIVEDETTYTYLYNVSELLENTDVRGIDYRWTVLPIGSLANVDTVRELFDVADREVAVLQEGSLSDQSLPSDVSGTAVSDHTGVGPNATVEDTLSTSFYLALVSRAYAGSLSDRPSLPDRITEGALGDTEGPIVGRLSAYFRANDIADGEFDRARPAEYLQRHRDDFVAELDMETKRTFGRLARGLNSTLEDFDGGSRRSKSFLGSLFGG